jgi:hypothetical protein
MPAERSTLQAIPGWLLTLPGHVLYYAEIITILVVGSLKIRVIPKLYPLFIPSATVSLPQRYEYLRLRIVVK